jgi:hypothetical protein
MATAGLILQSLHLSTPPARLRVGFAKFHNTEQIPKDPPSKPGPDSFSEFCSRYSCFRPGSILSAATRQSPASRGKTGGNLPVLREPGHGSEVLQIVSQPCGVDTVLLEAMNVPGTKGRSAAWVGGKRCPQPNQAAPDIIPIIWAPADNRFATVR